ncbi:SitI3 family protein [Amycolatopsis sp. DG1A-15b]|uniref:SitI3 family protein n=1 Tax=Amycolatopsis sp. DG1A-15b TaxID=3052846 RepID=UPI00255B632B|nr:SitI3 family protein [Amycolatopsis sp. DG1A-15b]WIX86701.1 SitI3 family protein [Amycolatopsis sp. DG1A-15b]
MAKKVATSTRCGRNLTTGRSAASRKPSQSTNKVKYSTFTPDARTRSNGYLLRSRNGDIIVAGASRTRTARRRPRVEALRDDLVRLSGGLLDRITGDALLSGMDTIWLMRRGSELTLNTRGDIWSERRLAALHQPHRRETLTFSEK